MRRQVPLGLDAQSGGAMRSRGPERYASFLRCSRFPSLATTITIGRLDIGGYAERCNNVKRDTLELWVGFTAFLAFAVALVIWPNFGSFIGGLVYPIEDYVKALAYQ